MKHTHTHTHTHIGGLLWTSDQPVAQTSTWQHTTLTRDRHIHAPGGIRTRNPSMRAAVGIGKYLVTRDYLGDHTTKNEMCGTCRGEGMWIRCFDGETWTKRFGRPSRRERIILIEILKEFVVRTWTGLIWLRIWTVCWLLWKRWWTSGFSKMCRYILFTHQQMHFLLNLESLNLY